VTIESIAIIEAGQNSGDWIVGQKSVGDERLRSANLQMKFLFGLSRKLRGKLKCAFTLQ
jgi:hypothetical protein